jgi:N-acetylmuramoyl-L-alanine amidase
MFDIIYGIMFLLLSTTSIISILVVVLFLSNRTKKQEVKSNEAEKSIKKLNER